MIVVGVDFGTTNVRISTRDSDMGDQVPYPVAIGSGSDGVTYMPAVVALRRLPGGDISVIVGEEADSEVGATDTVVIRNIKRYALSNDAYVSRHLEVANTHEKVSKWPPAWWNPEEQCVEVWGRKLPVWDLIGEILEEAFRRADIGEGFEWRAGCPVHAGFDYRKELTRTLCRITGCGNIEWIVQEPILFMNLVRELGNLGGASRGGSYLVYDFGGGSFDCALVEIEEGTGHMVVYGADGHPLLGGADIDRALVNRLGYGGQRDLLRKAKERLGPDNRSETLADGTVLTEEDFESILTDGRFVEHSLNSMRDAYMGAKVLWKRGDDDDDPPVGEVLTRNGETGAIRLVWQLDWDDMARDVDGIILIGGPTKSSHFRERLSARFGADSVLDTSKSLPMLAGVPDLELVGVSMGACYTYDYSHTPLYVNRLPVRVTLEHLDSGDRVEYEPFESLTRTFNPFEEYVSAEMVVPGRFGKTIRLTIDCLDGNVKERDFVDEPVAPKLVGYTLKLVIDRLGRIGVEQAHAGPYGGKYNRTTKRYMLFADTPWQTGRQREALQRQLEQHREFERRQDDRTSFYINRRPWDYPTP